LKTAAISAAGAMLAACGKAPPEPDQEKLSEAANNIQSTSEALLLDPEKMNQLLTEAREVNPQIWARWVEIRTEFPGETGRSGYRKLGGGIIYEERDGFMIILTAKHLFKSPGADNALKPVKITQSHLDNGLEMYCKQFGNADNYYRLVDGAGDLAALVIKTDRKTTMDLLAIADPKPGSTVYSLGNPSGNELPTLFPTKTLMPNRLSQDDGGFLVSREGFAEQASGDPVYDKDGVMGLVYREADRPERVIITTIKDKLEAMIEEIEKAKKDLV